MGSSTSQPEQHKVRTNLTDDQIRQNIHKLFLNNKTNTSDNSPLQTLGFNEVNDSIVNKVQQLGGLSTRNRYAKYEMELQELLQQGGDLDQIVSEVSELQRIKDMLGDNRNQFNFNLYGGNNESVGLPDTLPNETPVITNDTKKNSLSNFINLINKLKQMGGNGNGNNNTDDDDDVNNVVTSDINNNNNNNNNSNNNNNITPTPTPNVDSSDELENKVDANTSDAVFSETSFNSSTGINMLPFYSTTSESAYGNSHPYVKNRFN
jgi:hypothetical protein